MPILPTRRFSVFFSAVCMLAKLARVGLKGRPITMFQAHVRLFFHVFGCDGGGGVLVVGVDVVLVVVLSLNLFLLLGQ